jgi:DNA (cytosine-5)-methyltransferase 1
MEPLVEDVEIATEHGRGFWWKAQACRHTMSILGNYGDEWNIDTSTWYGEKDESFIETEPGLPDWYINPPSWCKADFNLKEFCKDLPVKIGEFKKPSSQGLVVDLFAGGGGASTGMSQALGRSPDIAINHDADAIAMHEANHPDTLHYHCDIFEVHPLMATKGRRVSILWASPSCTHFSRARAGVPKEEQMRTQPYVVTWWARHTRPDIIFVENVPEIRTWGPLDDEGQPITEKKGKSFNHWIWSLKRYGYKVEYRLLKACDYGAPTSRERFFLIARCDGQPIVWPEPTHASPDHWDVINGELEPHRTASEIMDWSDLGHSIFLTREEVKASGLRCKRPLAGSTLRRVAKGLDKFVFDNANPFLLHIQHTSNQNGTIDINKPLPTITARPKGGGMAVVSPFIAKHYTGITGQKVEQPLSTITAWDHHSLVSPTLIQMGYGERPGQESRCLDLDKPLGTVVAGGNKFAIASAHIQRDFGQSVGGDMREPLPSITSSGGGHNALVSGFVVKSNHTAKDYEAFRGQSLQEPIHTITSRHGTGIAIPFISKMRGQNIGYGVDEPVQTISARGQHHALTGCLVEYYGQGIASDLNEPMRTATTKDRFGFVTAEMQYAYVGASDTIYVVTATAICFKGGPIWIDGEAMIILDISMRMMKARELASGNGFDEDYEIEHGANGRLLSVKSQVEKIGNSVPPHIPKALTRVNFVEMYDLAEVSG